MNEMSSTSATTGKHISPTFIWHAVLSQRYNVLDPDGVLCRWALLFYFLFALAAVRGATMRLLSLPPLLLTKFTEFSLSTFTRRLH